MPARAQAEIGVFTPQPWSALADREAVVDGERHILGRLAAGERTEVRGASSRTTRTTDSRGKGSSVILIHLSAFRELRPTVVTRCVTADQPQLGDIGLQLGDTWHGFHSGSQPDHLVDPRPLLGSGEIGADPSPDVLGLSDVENVALTVVLGNEQIDPGRFRQAGGPGALGAPLR